MNADEEVVVAVFKELLEENSGRYRRSLENLDDSGVDVYGRARKALAKLDDAERLDVFRFIDVVIADSASVILGMLDGSHFPDGVDGDFSVVYKGGEIQGGLQDMFIEKAEDKGVYG